MTIGQKIKKLRKEKKWTQEDLARKLNVLQPHINRWERDKCSPSLEALKKLSELFNISIDSLILDERDLKKLSLKDKSVLSKLKQLETLSPKDKDTIIHLIDSLTLKSA